MLRFFQVEDRTLKRHISIGVFVVYIDTGSSMPISPSKSRDLADENNKIWRNGNDSKQPYCSLLISVNTWIYRPVKSILTSVNILLTVCNQALTKGDHMNDLILSNSTEVGKVHTSICINIICYDIFLVWYSRLRIQEGHHRRYYFTMEPYGEWMNLFYLKQMNR